jgi:hypothetical protein
MEDSLMGGACGMYGRNKYRQGFDEETRDKQTLVKALD